MGLAVYREWDYDRMVVTAYRRSGKCKKCGACCRAHVSFGYMMPPRAGDPRKGGNTTDAVGVWQELDAGRWRYFYRITVNLEENVCGGLQEDGCCADHEDPDRSMLCQIWPLTPADISKFPNCGWSFEEVGRWPLTEEDLYYAKEETC
jgi:hypothetical protein